MFYKDLTEESKKPSSLMKMCWKLAKELCCFHSSVEHCKLMLVSIHQALPPAAQRVYLRICPTSLVTSRITSASQNQLGHVSTCFTLAASIIWADLRQTLLPKAFQYLLYSPFKYIYYINIIFLSSISYALSSESLVTFLITSVLSIHQIWCTWDLTL